MLKRGLIFVFALALAAISSAQSQGYTSYTTTIFEAYESPVTNIIMFERHATGGSATWAFEAQGAATTVLDNPFLQNPLPTRSLLFGITNGLPLDGEDPLDHVVIFMNQGLGSYVEGQLWENLFPNFLESNILQGILDITTGTTEEQVNAGFAAIDPFLNYLESFTAPDENQYSAWFNTGDDFSVMAFSDAVNIGTGSSSITPVPEPTTMGMAAFGVLAYLRRRKANAKK
jgi:hypothetical protein